MPKKKISLDYLGLLNLFLLYQSLNLKRKKVIRGKEIETIKKVNQELIEALDLIEIKAIIREDKIIKVNRQIKKKGQNKKSSKPVVIPPKKN